MGDDATELNINSDCLAENVVFKIGFELLQDDNIIAITRARK